MEQTLVVKLANEVSVRQIAVSEDIQLHLLVIDRLLYLDFLLRRLLKVPQIRLLVFLILWLKLI